MLKEINSLYNTVISKLSRVLDIKKADEGVTPLVIDLVGNHSKFEWSSKRQARFSKTKRTV